MANEVRYVGLRETLDLIATAVASMSDRIDDLTAVADKQIKVATKARSAAFAARDQTIGALAKSEDDKSRTYREVFEREQKADCLKSRLPWLVWVHWLWPWC